MIKILFPAVLAASLLCAPLARAEPGDQISAEQAVAAIYKQVVPGCTEGHDFAHLQSINWTSFSPRSFGEGRIVDFTDSLGGPFKVVSLTHGTVLRRMWCRTVRSANGALIWSSADAECLIGSLPSRGSKPPAGWCWKAPATPVARPER